MSNAVAILPQRVSLVEKMATKFSIEPTKMLAALKATAFRLNKGEVSNEQMVALLVVADQYGLNPWTKEIFAFPDKENSIVPVVGVDGWSRIINDNPALDGITFTYSEKTIEHKGKVCHDWIECHINRKDRSHPVIVREYFTEVVRDLNYKTPWDTHPNRMHRHKALIQCARIAFGFGGIYDEDEAERIIEAEAIPANITPNSGAGDDLTAAQKQIVLDTSALIRKALAEGREWDAYSIYVTVTEISDILYLTSLLNSKERSTLKRMVAAERKADNPSIESEAGGGTIFNDIMAIIESALAIKDKDVALLRLEDAENLMSELSKDDFASANKAFSAAKKELQERKA